MKADTIVLYPSPGKGHLASMVELGKRLLGHHRPPVVSVTVIISVPPNEADNITTTYLSSVSSTHPNISFLHLPTPVVPPDFFSPANNVSAFFEFPRLNNPGLHAALSDSGTSTIKALILDFFCSAASQVGASLGIPVYYFQTSGACALADFFYIPTIHAKIPHSYKDLDPKTLIEIPGIPPVRPRDMPPVLCDRGSKAYGLFLETAHDMARAAGILINTFDSLEVSAIKAIRNGLCVTNGPTPPTYCVGPLIAAQDSDEAAGNRHECLRWLDSQPSRSVVFLSFGSMGRFSAKQLKEMALGLERSRVRFVWVVRSPPANGEALRDISDADPSILHFLPDGFLEGTKERGFVIESWAPQVAVLNHGSVGGFVTHCGWNSILEAVCAGVPMLAWPLYAEQKLNRNYIVEEIGMALPVKASEDGFVSADELETRLTELMSSEKGEAVRERVLTVKEEAAAALSEGGSSRAALAELIQTVKQGPVKSAGFDPVEIGSEFGGPNPV